VSRRKLRLAKRAVGDIEGVLAYTLEQFGERKHQQYKELIAQALADIVANPEAPPAKYRPEIHPDAWTFHIGRSRRRARHFFLYRIAGDRFIDIGRFLHDSMDLRRHLPDDFAAEE
jgi:toxin ParE1/3/4